MGHYQAARACIGWQFRKQQITEEPSVSGSNKVWIQYLFPSLSCCSVRAELKIDSDVIRYNCVGTSKRHVWRPHSVFSPHVPTPDGLKEATGDANITRAHAHMHIWGATPHPGEPSYWDPCRDQNQRRKERGATSKRIWMVENGWDDDGTWSSNTHTLENYFQIKYWKRDRRWSLLCSSLVRWF